jgi:outer membrane protein assembly factor BamB
MRRAATILALLLPMAAGARAGNWPMFRGPDGNGISAEKGLPLKWGPDRNVRWKAALPAPGNSSPVVSGDRVFVTCPSDGGKDRNLFCFDRHSGKQLWVRTVAGSAKEPSHATNPYCSPSPAADGERVVVWYGAAGLHCYCYAGQKLWSRDLGTFEHIWGYGSSPVLYKDVLLLNCGPGRRQFVTALDRRTGKTLWETDEPAAGPADKPREQRWVGSWSTPVLARIDGRDQAVVGMPHHVRAYDPDTGKVLWSVEGLGDLVYTSAVLGGPFGVVMSGYSGPAVGFRVGGSGDVTAHNRLWRHTAKIPQRIGTGVLLGKQLFVVNEPGTVQCLEVETGKELWKDRLPGSAKVWGSVLCAEGRLYVTDQAGTTHVFAPNPARLELLAQNKLGEGSNSTPALSDGQIILRTFKHLYCIAEPSK